MERSGAPGSPHCREWPDFLARWALRLDGPAGHGMAALVLPVICADGTAAVLKLQPVDNENVGEPIGLLIGEAPAPDRRRDGQRAMLSWRDLR